MDTDKLARCGVGEPRQPFSVVARIDWDDGFPEFPDRKAFVIVPRGEVPDAGGPAVPGGNGSRGGDSM
ncbi:MULTISPECIES: hypothetical protein [unclassified Methanoculleus]|jgi:hypothetical protein|uniref:Uncharacterized protein n=1 Tax=Methanoculleus palmolei TaxID=72612 RepID=A0ABD8ABA7_9EURY|nr:hypothetical protein [Methanoculleus sp. UBA377]WOX56353.1 hypothetical protein R6Y95_03205 [Methanoculleus palmolei]